MNKLTIILLFFCQFGYAQSTELLETIDEIQFGQDTIESVFTWVAENIKYDIKKLEKIESIKRTDKNSDFSSEEEYQDHLLKKVIKSKKGVCEDYALLLHEFVTQLGYDSYIINGYVKDSKGRVAKKVGHAWNAIKVNGEWQLFDPTWGSGHVVDEKKFVKAFNIEWYNVDPKEMIKTHMPYDPVWQFLDRPMTYKEFENNLEVAYSEAALNYNELIESSDQKDKQQQMRDQLARSEKMGDGIGLIKKWRRHTEKNISTYGITSQKDLLDTATASANKAAGLYNEFVKASSKKFKGKKYAQHIAKQNLEVAKEEIVSALEIFESVDVEDRKAASYISKSIRSATGLLKSIDRGLSVM